MYLLMLLATFISAIYGYNLSPRPDYERDLSYKKASAVMYKFMWQEDTIYKQVLRIMSYDDAIASSYGVGGQNHISPGDMFYGDETDNRKLIIKSASLGTANFYLYYGKKNGQRDSANYLPPGMTLYNGKEMVTKYVCLKPDQSFDGHAAENCVDETEELPAGVDENGNPITTTGVTGFCCFAPGVRRYLISYKKIDARFINRISGGVSLDFYKTLRERRPVENVGIIVWDDDHWKFDGKISLNDIYQDEIEKWNRDHTKDGKLEISYPANNRQKTSWVMPDYFDEDFFENMDGDNICEKGCLFRIRSLTN